MPCWCGEFYFEYHRGVFTTMARNKRYNRLAEFTNAAESATKTISFLFIYSFQEKIMIAGR